jgi:hypothetical protein
LQLLAMSSPFPPGSHLSNQLSGDEIHKVNS